MKNCKLMSIDLAKNVFQVCQLDENNKIIKNRKMSRPELAEFITNTPRTVIAMEACYTSHYWGRVCEQAGHTVRLIPAQHVKPFVRGNKNDSNDALAIAEAAQRPNLKFVPVKSRRQQDMQSLHRIRERVVRQRTGLINQTRGLLSDYGIVGQGGIKSFNSMLRTLCDSESEVLSPLLKEQLLLINEEMSAVTERLDQLNRQIKALVLEDPIATRLMTIPGIGVLVASALSSAIGAGQQFNNARELAVWMGLTPKHSASGNTMKPSGISKRGNRYLRKQLCHGARAVLTISKKKDDPLVSWARKLSERRGINKATVALANRIARLAWTLLQKQEDYRVMPTS